MFRKWTAVLLDILIYFFPLNMLFKIEMRYFSKLGKFSAKQPLWFPMGCTTLGKPCGTGGIGGECQEMGTVLAWRLSCSAGPNPLGLPLCSSCIVTLQILPSIGGDSSAPLVPGRPVTDFPSYNAVVVMCHFQVWNSRDFALFCWCPWEPYHCVWTRLS